MCAAAEGTDAHKGADPDTLVASAKAYLGALNKLMIKRQRGVPEPLAVGERRIHSTERLVTP